MTKDLIGKNECEVGATELVMNPASELFPMLPEAELEALAYDISTNGLRAPIVLDPEGRILDGRNRYKACQHANVAPKFTTYDGDDPLGFVISCNIKRRHLSESQRAMVAASLASNEHGGDRKSDQVADLQLDSHTQEQAAGLLNVSPRLVSIASKLHKKLAPDVIAVLQAGQFTVHDAERLSVLPMPGQCKSLSHAVEKGITLAKAAESTGLMESTPSTHESRRGAGVSGKTQAVERASEMTRDQQPTSTKSPVFDADTLASRYSLMLTMLIDGRDFQIISNMLFRDIDALARPENTKRVRHLRRARERLSQKLQPLIEPASQEAIQNHSLEMNN